MDPMGNDELEFCENIALTVQRFRPLSTALTGGFQLLLTISLGFLALFLHVSKYTIDKPCNDFAIILLSQAAFWAISLIIDHYYKYRHHFLQLDGHFTFYKQISRIANLLLAAISIWNAIILILLAILYMVKQEDSLFCEGRGNGSPFFYLCIAVILESVACIGILLTYLVRVSNFNSTKPLTDIDHYECRISDPGVDYEVGYRFQGEAISDLLEKYVNLLNYYKSANDELCRVLKNLQNVR
ncbi:uncharacterized protein LOC106663396 [Cimex lectularius]|uniref:Transmembrane protein 192 n=1 Tax=Cimex lectularius TaxID=79782 RepID=A0A8I6RI27_CIMLE|nr:uncharacterized protein LOC106663396 [Cimex lectularius]